METMMTLLILRLVVEIQVGFLNAEVIPELSRYETEDWVRSKWDTMQSEYRCCGGYGHYQVTSRALNEPSRSLHFVALSKFHINLPCFHLAKCLNRFLIVKALTRRRPLVKL